MSKAERPPKSKQSRPMMMAADRPPAGGGAHRDLEAEQAEVAGDYRSLFENALDGVFRSTLDGRYLTANPAFARMLGYGSPAQLMESVTDIARQLYVEPDHRAAFVEQVKSQQAVSNFETQLRRRDGTLIWVSVSARPVHNVRGEVVWLEGIAEDITARKRAEAALAESEQRYRTLFTESREAMNLTIGGLIEDVNPAWLRLHGYGDRSEAVGRDILEMIHPEDRPKLAAWRAAPNRNVSELRQFRNLRQDGSVVEVEVYSSEMFLRGRRAVLTTVRDITEQKRAERMLHDSELLYHSLVDNLPQCVFRKNREGRLTFANAAYCRMLGRPLEELLGKTDFDLFPHEMAEKYRRDDQRVMDAQQLLQTVEVNRRSGGKDLMVEVTKTPLRDVEGRVTGVQGIFWDVTERKQAEEKLRQSELNLAIAQRMAHVGSWTAELKSLEDFSQNPLWWSDETYRIFGYEPGAVPVTHAMFTRAIVPAERERVWAEVRAALHDRRPYNIEHRLLRPDGAERIVHEHAEVIYDEASGRPVRFVGTVQDITARKRGEEALLLSYSLLGATLEATADGILVVDSAGKVTSFNQKFLDLWRIPASLVATRDDRQMIRFVLEQLKDPAGFQAKISELYANPAASSQDELEFRDGRVFERSSQPQHLGDDIVGRVWSFRDITARKQSEQKLRDRETELLEAQSVALIGSYVLDIATSCWTSSATLDQILDIGPDFPRTVDAWPELLHPEDRQPMLDYLRLEVIGKKKPFDREYRIVRYRDKQMRWVHGLGRLQFDGAGNPTTMVGTIQDITEHRQAEEQHQRLTTAVEQAAEAILITDAAGGILYVNPAFEKITGHNRREILGQNPRLLKSGKHEAAFYQRMWETLARGDVWSGRLTNRKKDGTFYEEEATLSAIRDADGRIVNYVGVLRDVTRETALEDRFRQAQKMEAVGRLAGGIAHDFNNILTAILGYCQLAIAGVSREDPVQNYMAAVQESANRAASLTSQLLAFSRKQVLLSQPLDFNTVVVRMREMLRRLINANIQIVTPLDPAAGRVRADPNQIEQVIMNLAVNAGDAMPHGGTLTISTANVEMDEAQARAHDDIKPGRYVRLSVADTGVGLTPEVKAHLFEPFFTTKQFGKGTGLGLATVYGIIAQSGGHITVDSELGRGTTFHILLPRIEQPAAQAPSAPAAHDLPCGSETILLAEDEPRVREMAHAILTDAGYNVIEAKDGADALWMAKRHAGGIHLLLTDVVMPGLGGIELSKRLLAERPGLRVLYMSGYIESEVLPDQFLRPGVAFLQKPFYPAALAAKVRELLDAPPVG